ncbi:hypothetical protein PV325_003426 [Microctonus aethiopoides]|nr:hypothetical protein PV325_003426 [Microctonus aethiopoides]KAK0098754.1 hypothetical protein PV326_004033 [Microctonus aethiopoides]
MSPRLEYLFGILILMASLGSIIRAQEESKPVKINDEKNTKGIVGTMQGYLSPITNVILEYLNSALIHTRDESATVLNTALTLRSRQKRGISDSLGNLALQILSAPFRIFFTIFQAPLRIIASILNVPYTIISNIIMGPIRIFRSIFSIIFSPFRLIFRAISWPARLLFNRNDNQSRDATNASVNSTSNPTDDSAELGIMDRLSESIHNMINSILARAWNFTKINLFPKINEFIQQLQASNIIPSNIKSMLNSIHSVYEILHVLNIL